MKVLIISDTSVEVGRGPVTRLLGVLPPLVQRAEVVLVSLGKPDKLGEPVIRREVSRLHFVDFALDGWNVRHCDALTAQLVEIVKAERPDVVVLYREIWDLMKSLSAAMNTLGVAFGTMLHSMPFLDAIPRPTGFFYLDIARQIIQERRFFAINYAFRHAHEAWPVLLRQGAVVINETVASYMDTYFPRARVFKAIPGYAIDLERIEAAPPAPGTYDFAFMAKLTEGKGLFDLLRIFAHIREQQPQSRLLLIGSFEERRVEERFHRTARQLGVQDGVELAGWLEGQAKYERLKSARVFLYPSISADTFSFCLLEALACGLPAVCYDVPFSRATYQTPAVTRTGFRQHKAFAHAAVNLLRDPRGPELSAAARTFARGYSSWPAVAESELRAYEQLLADKALQSFRSAARPEAR